MPNDVCEVLALGSEAGWQARLIKEKERVDTKNALEGMKRALVSSDFYEDEVSKALTRGRDDLMFGDYGSGFNFQNEYMLNLALRNLDFRNPDGDLMTVADIKTIAPGSNYTFVSERGNVLRGERLSRDGNFSTWFQNLGEEQISALDDEMRQIREQGLLFKVSDIISERQDAVFNSTGVVEIAADQTEYNDIFRLGLCKLGWNGIAQFDNFELNKIVGMIGNGGLNLGQDKAIVVEKDESGKVLGITITTGSKGLYLSIFPSDSNGLDLHWKIDTDEISGRNKEGVFLKSKAASEIIGAFEKAGMVPSEEMMNAITEGTLGVGEFSQRFGNGYADLSRLISLQVGKVNGEDRLRSLFKNYDVDKLTKMTLGIDSLSEPTKLIFGMICDLASPITDGDNAKYWHNDRSIRDGSCKDAEVYFYVSFWGSQPRPREDDLFYYKEKYGIETALLKKGIVINGVRIPAGFLCRVNEGGDVEPLRATMFCFEPEDAKDAFGRQFFEAQREEALISDLVSTLRKVIARKGGSV